MIVSQAQLRAVAKFQAPKLAAQAIDYNYVGNVMVCILHCAFSCGVRRGV